MKLVDILPQINLLDRIEKQQLLEILTAQLHPPQQDRDMLKTSSLAEMFSQLRQLCEEQQYSLDIPDRTDRESPLLDDE